ISTVPGKRQLVTATGNRSITGGGIGYRKMQCRYGITPGRIGKEFGNRSAGSIISTVPGKRKLIGTFGYNCITGGSIGYRKMQCRYGITTSRIGKESGDNSAGSIIGTVPGKRKLITATGNRSITGRSIGHCKMQGSHGITPGRIGK